MSGDLLLSPFFHIVLHWAAFSDHQIFFSPKELSELSLSLSALKGPFIFVLSQVCSVRLGIMCKKLALTFAVPYQKGQDVPPPLPSPPRRECSRDKHVYAFAGCSENTPNQESSLTSHKTCI